MYTHLGTIIPSVSGCVRIEYNIENVTNLTASSGLNVPLLLVSCPERAATALCRSSDRLCSSHLTPPSASHRAPRSCCIVLYLQLSHWSLWPDSSWQADKLEPRKFDDEIGNHPRTLKCLSSLDSSSLSFLLQFDDSVARKRFELDLESNRNETDDD